MKQKKLLVIRIMAKNGLPRGGILVIIRRTYFEFEGKSVVICTFDSLLK